MVIIMLSSLLMLGLVVKALKDHYYTGRKISHSSAPMIKLLIIMPDWMKRILNVPVW